MFSAPISFPSRPFSISPHASILPLLSLFLLFLATLLPSACTQCSEASADYKITFTYNWTREFDTSFPDKDPEVTPGFTKVLCVSHNTNFTLWANKEQLSIPVVRYFKRGIDEKALQPLLHHLDGRNKSAPPDVFQYATGEEAFLDGTGSTELLLSVRSRDNFTHISCITRIWPSADWFTGISNLAMCKTGQKFTSEPGQGLFGWDGGINVSDVYTKDEVPAEPEQLPVQRVLIVTPNGYGIASFTRQDVSPSPTPASDPSCFPADEPTLSADGSWIPMHALRLHHVLHASLSSSIPNSLSSPTHPGRIFLFSHRDPVVMAEFIRLSFHDPVDGPGTIRVSPGHLVLVHHINPPSSLDPYRSVPAAVVGIGDHLVCLNGGRCTVTDTTVVRARGLYNPHPLSGKLVVSGVWVTAYTTAISPAIASALLTPLRALSILGLSMPLQPLVDRLVTLGRVVITRMIPNSMLAM